MIQCKINGVEHSFSDDPEMPLLWYLRDQLQLTGTKYGCGMGLCGACTVHVDGAATRSCITVMRSVAGKDVLTIEGLSRHGDHPVQQAWKAGNVPPPIGSTFDTAARYGSAGEMAQGWVDLPFDIPHLRAENGPA
jgi:aerobic-type carbon monoxide dehydrogenase small subunit (CoxS/CutS family)